MAVDFPKTGESAFDITIFLLILKEQSSRNDFVLVAGLSKSTTVLIELLTSHVASWKRRVAERPVESDYYSSLTGDLDESKRILGTLYRNMKPLLDDFDPEITTEYDDCLRGIPHDQYLRRAGELKAHYGISLPSLG